MAPNEHNAPVNAGGGGGSQAQPADETSPLLPREPESPSHLSFTQHIKKLRRERWVSLAASAVLMIALVTIAVLFGVYRSRHHKMAASAVCLTPACVHAASEFLYNLSPNHANIDACTNFEELVCGGWKARHTIRPDQSYTGVFNSISEESESILRNVLENPYPGSSAHSAFSPRSLQVQTHSIDESNFDTLQRAYNVCMSVPQIEKQGLEPLERLVHQLTKAFGNGSDWSDTLLFFQHISMSPLVSISVGEDEKNPDIQVISVGPTSSPGLPSKEYYLKPGVIADYESAIAQVLGSVKSGIKDGKKAAKAIVEFETKLAAMSPSLADFADISKTYHPMALKATAKLLPSLGLESILQSLVPKGYKLDQVITAFPDVLSDLGHFIANTPKETLEAFFTWKLVSATSRFVEAKEVEQYREFSRKLAGRDPKVVPERYRVCIGYVDDTLGWILSRFFIELAFSGKAKDDGNRIVSDIKEVFKARIKALDWIDDEVKTLAISKVNNIRQKVGYPTESPNIEDPKSLQDYYSGLNVTNVYFDNALAAARFSAAADWAELGKPTNKDKFGMTASTVNAYYNPPGNEIVFPAGIMQFPLFGDLPGYVNYGAFGAVAGHELSHAFDNSGRQYDEDGKYNDWWTNHTVKEFKQRAKCFVKQFSNFTVEGVDGTLHVDGKQTLGENIADSGGLSAAWSAWQRRREAHPDQHLPGLEGFTQEQLFYISFGNIWCAKYTPSALTSRVLTDYHSPNMWRIMGTTMNSRGFKQAFNCPSKEPVCEIW